MTPLVYGSVCSGIEAASVAWKPLGWEAAFFAEIEPFPSAVLSHRHSETPNLGDFTTIQRSPRPIDLLVGGTPCQSFSVAGLRGGLADERGNLALEFLRLADRLRPQWLVWENVPGVLSSWSDDPDCPPRDVDGDGQRGQAQVVQQRHDFGCFLGALAELGYGFAYRVLDAQYFGVPQRRRRVFVVGCLGDWRGAAAVLFERHCLSGNPPPSRKTQADIAASTARSLRTRSNLAHREDADTLIAGTLTREYGEQSGNGLGEMANGLIARTLAVHPSGRYDGDTKTFVPEVAFGLQSQAGRYENGSRIGNAWNTNYIAHTLRGEGFDASEDGTGRGTPLVPVAFIVNAAESCATQSHARQSEVARCLDQTGGFASNQGGTVVAAWDPRNVTSNVNRTRVEPGLPCPTLHGQGMSIIGAGVRRLTPLEAERLQGFPDHYTAIPYRGKPAADGPRYKALGNSMAIPPMVWLGRRINAVRAAMEVAR